MSKSADFRAVTASMPCTAQLMTKPEGVIRRTRLRKDRVLFQVNARRFGRQGDVKAIIHQDPGWAAGHSPHQRPDELGQLACFEVGLAHLDEVNACLGGCVDLMV